MVLDSVLMSYRDILTMSRNKFLEITYSNRVLFLPIGPDYTIYIDDDMVCKVIVFALKIVVRSLQLYWPKK